MGFCNIFEKIWQSKPQPESEESKDGNINNGYIDLYSNLYAKEWALEKHKITRERIKNPKSIWGKRRD